MRLASFHAADGIRPAVVVGDDVVDLAAADRSLRAPWAELLGRPDCLERAREIGEWSTHRMPLGSVRLAAPVQPRKFFAIGLNYADHVAESGQAMPEHLTVFVKAASCVTGPYDPVERPAVSDFLDYEGELGFVIGKRCRPYVNGELRQQSNTRELIFDCFRQVEILSQACTLEPGDVIATGTPSGIAAGMEGRPWLKPGDHVRVEIDGLGAIENVVVHEDVTSDEARARPEERIS
jgi:2-keto-4-pentenoate hydratase/2-oxohepta-3-ene-1,7-dioic acid hydratase in catechol pathway